MINWKCDQIGIFLDYLSDKVCNNSSPNTGWLRVYFEKCHILNKNDCAYFLGNFRLTFGNHILLKSTLLCFILQIDKKINEKESGDWQCSTTASIIAIILTSLKSYFKLQRHQRTFLGKILTFWTPFMATTIWCNNLC